MPVLHLADVPGDVYQRLQSLAAAHNRNIAEEAVELLRERLLAEQLPGAQETLLADLRRRSYTPPPGTPDSAELLRQDRDR